MDNDKTHKKQHALLSLPTEIRLMIYGHLLQSQYTGKIFVINRFFLHFRTSRVDRALLRTCKVICTEATEVLYSKHTLSFDDNPLRKAKRQKYAGAPSPQQSDDTLIGMHGFLQQIGPDNRQNLRHIRLNFSNSHCDWYPEIIGSDLDPSYMSRALALLCGNNSMRTFEIRFDARATSIAFARFFFQEWKYRLYSRLRLLKNIKEATCLQQDPRLFLYGKSNLELLCIAIRAEKKLEYRVEGTSMIDLLARGVVAASKELQPVTDGIDESCHSEVPSLPSLADCLADELP